MDKLQLQEKADECFCKSEFAFALGKTYYNGRIGKEIDKLVEIHQLDISHFDYSKKNREVNQKYIWIEKDCPQCGEKFKTKKGHPREQKTCSRKCSNIYFADKRLPNEEFKTIQCKTCKKDMKVKSQDQNEKECDECLGVHRSYFMRKTKHGFKKQISVTKKVPCSECGILIKQKTKYGKCRTCVFKDLEYRKLLSDSMKKKVEDGTHNGWKVRSKNNPSYPEKFFMRVLNNNDIEYEYEKPTGGFFIDFAIGDKIALEIDGKQHLEDDRKERDARKDKFLTENGWIVHRIPWKSINNKKGKQYIGEEIEKFLNLYYTHFKKTS